MRKEFMELRLDMALLMLERIHRDLATDEELNANDKTVSELGEIVVRMKNLYKDFKKS